jgi:hypothetical protein
MTEGLAEPQWLNLAKKRPTIHTMAKTICFMTCAHHGIGDEIARAVLAVGTSLPSQTSDASWPSPKGESQGWLVDLVTAPSMQEVEPRRLPSVVFTPSGPFVYQWQKNRSEAFCRP